MVKQVRFFVLNDDGFKESGRAVLKNGEVRLEGIPRKYLMSLDMGMTNIKDVSPREKWFQTDGLPFLELLPGRFRGSYFKASLVEEVEGDEMVELEEIEEMAYAITLGEKTPPSKWDQEHRDQWKRLSIQIKEIKAKGGTVDIPMETP